MKSKRKINLWKRLLLFAGILLIIFNILLAFQAYRLTYFYESGTVAFRKPEQMTVSEKITGSIFGFKFPKRKIDTFPSVPYQVVKLKEVNQPMLESWWIKADSASKGTVILFHGHANNKQKVLAETYFFHKLGYNTFSVDLRAHGNSEGNVCTVGYFESDDVKRAYDFIRSKGEKNIILWGISLGAATILKSIKDYDIRPQKIIIECPFGSMLDATRGRIRTMGIPPTPLSEILLFWGSLERHFWAFDHAPAEYAKSVKCPVLLNWGKNDKRVTIEETHQIFNNLPVAAKKLVIFEHSGHQSFCKNEKALWEKEVSSFLKQ